MLQDVYKNEGLAALNAFSVPDLTWEEVKLLKGPDTVGLGFGGHAIGAGFPEGGQGPPAELPAPPRHALAVGVHTLMPGQEHTDGVAPCPALGVADDASDRVCSNGGSGCAMGSGQTVSKSAVLKESVANIAHIQGVTGDTQQVQDENDFEDLDAVD